MQRFKLFPQLVFPCSLSKKALSKIGAYILIFSFFIIYTAYFSQFIQLIFAATPGPYYSNLKTIPASPATYTQVGIQFNATWTDSNTVSKVFLEINGTNTTVSNTQGGEYYVNNTLGAGTHYYRWIANNTLGIWNTTWNDNNFKYRKPITLSTTSSLTDYQIKITTDTSSLVSAGKMQSDCDDIRFMDFNGTVLNYWIESGCNSASTSIWIKVPEISSSGNTIYMYYGNSSVSVASSGANTFIVFDNFEGSDTWTYSETHTNWKGTITSNYSSSTSNSYYLGGDGVEIEISTGYYAQISKSFSSNQVSVSAKLKTYTDYTSAGYVSCRALLDSTQISTTDVYPTSSFTTISYNATSSFTSIIFRAISTNDITNPSMWRHSCYWDDVIMRKYTSTEPTTSIGTEEIRQNYTISKESGAVSFSLSPSSPVIYPTQTNASCIRTAGDHASTITLYRNGSQVASGTTSPQSEVTTLIGGIYNYTCVLSTSQNYTEATSASNILNVVPTLADITIFLNISKVWWNDSVYASGIKIYSNGTIGSGDSYTFYINGVSQCSGTTNSSGGWSCTFRVPIEIGSFYANITSTSASVTSINSTILRVRPNYGQTPSGTSDRAVYENPFFIQDMNGKLKMVMVRITTWKR